MKATRLQIVVVLGLSALVITPRNAPAESNAQAMLRIQAEQTRQQQQAHDEMIKRAAQEQDEWNARLTQQIAEGEARNAQLRLQNEAAARQALAAQQKLAGQAVQAQPAAGFGPAPLVAPRGLQGQALRNWLNAQAVGKLQAAGFRSKPNPVAQ